METTMGKGILLCRWGGHHGPSLAAKTACESQSLADLFIFFFTIQFLETIARETNRYSNKDWVRPVPPTRSSDDDSILNGDGDDPEEANEQPKSKHRLQPCPASHPDSRHRFKGLSKKWKPVTPGFILVYFGIICILGATKN
jgi:hypothetical protein